MGFPSSGVHTRIISWHQLDLPIILLQVLKDINLPRDASTDSGNTDPEEDASTRMHHLLISPRGNVSYDQSSFVVVFPVSPADGGGEGGNGCKL